jgi:hypothetical protein
LKGLSSEKSRHIVLRAGPDEMLPDFFEREMREHAVLCGWLRASGVLTEVELRAYGADIGGHGVGRRIAGPVQAVMIEGSVGLTDGDVSVGMRAVLARESDRGIEALAGEIVTARVIALEGVVTAFDDLAMPRALDAHSAIWLFGESGTKQAGAIDFPRDPRPIGAGAISPPRAGGTPAPKPVNPAWSEAIAASASASTGPARPSAPRITGPGAAIPIRPVRPTKDFDEGPFPETGDIVEHFAFGTCEVLRSDGDRLHLKVHKDGRIREIALEMLKVSLLTTDGETQRYRLDRKL